MPTKDLIARLHSRYRCSPVLEHAVGHRPQPLQPHTRSVSRSSPARVGSAVIRMRWSRSPLCTFQAYSVEMRRVPRPPGCPDRSAQLDYSGRTLFVATVRFWQPISASNLAFNAAARILPKKVPGGNWPRLRLGRGPSLFLGTSYLNTWVWAGLAAPDHASPRSGGCPFLALQLKKRPAAIIIYGSRQNYRMTSAPLSRSINTAFL